MTSRLSDGFYRLNLSAQTRPITSISHKPGADGPVDLSTTQNGSVIDGDSGWTASYAENTGDTDHSIVLSSFHDRFTDTPADLLDHAVEEVAGPHQVEPTVSRLQLLLSEFEATHNA